MGARRAGIGRRNGRPVPPCSMPTYTSRIQASGLRDYRRLQCPRGRRLRSSWVPRRALLHTVFANNEYQRPLSRIHLSHECLIPYLYTRTRQRQSCPIYTSPWSCTRHPAHSHASECLPPYYVYTYICVCIYTSYRYGVYRLSQPKLEALHYYP